MAIAQVQPTINELTTLEQSLRSGAITGITLDESEMYYEYTLALFFAELADCIVGYFAHQEGHSIKDDLPLNYNTFKAIVETYNDLGRAVGVEEGKLLTPPDTADSPRLRNFYRMWMNTTFPIVGEAIEDAGFTPEDNPGIRSLGISGINPMSSNADNAGTITLGLSNNYNTRVKVMIGTHPVPQNFLNHRYNIGNIGTRVAGPISYFNWAGLSFSVYGMGLGLINLQNWLNYFANYDAQFMQTVQSCQELYRIVFGPILSPPPSDEELATWPVSPATMNYMAQCVMEAMTCTRTVTNQITGVISEQVKTWMIATIASGKTPWAGHLVAGGANTYCNAMLEWNIQGLKRALNAINVLTHTTCWVYPRQNWYYNFVDRFLW